MKKITQKALKALVNNGEAIDITRADVSTFYAIKKEEECAPVTVAVSCGAYGANGALLKGLKTGKLYAITGRTSALFIFM